MKLLFKLIFILLLTNCKSQKTAFAYSSENLKIIKLSEHSFVHVSYLNTDDFGKVACNGLVYIDKNEAVVFDTPTTTAVSLELIKWIADVKKCKITAVVINHFHADCLGGLEAFHSIGASSFANNKTIVLAKANNFTIPTIGFENQMEIKVGNKKVLNTFFGEAHTLDNIVSYIPSEKLLFGGCMVKGLNATKGFTGDANLEDWSNTIRSIKAQYPEIETVIPGHGDSGNTTLLDYTIQLFE